MSLSSRADGPTQGLLGAPPYCSKCPDGRFDAHEARPDDHPVAPGHDRLRPPRGSRRRAAGRGTRPRPRGSAGRLCRGRRAAQGGRK
ncbi:hypothetical protein CTA1_3582 [Colletotrichum tanaceti]|uniref:Uncharacterized protein n=1 Tax=Colletotrichum tanaceti TaxID=1306861 RepID=A0A4U6XHK9_9PEZI|nr:hypothetical protein CTA1_3582 [Colletotrichum tanaceti]